MIYADSRRMWRIIENLFQNICKYALEGTRVYLEMKVEGGRVTASLKNISDRPMNLKGEELSERFIRGDASRTTEGSGLGLYIAKILPRPSMVNFRFSWTEICLKSFWISRSTRDRRRRRQRFRLKL